MNPVHTTLAAVAALAAAGAVQERGSRAAPAVAAAGTLAARYGPVLAAYGIQVISNMTRKQISRYLSLDRSGQVKMIRRRLLLAPGLGWAVRTYIRKDDRAESLAQLIEDFFRDHGKQAVNIAESMAQAQAGRRFGSAAMAPGYRSWKWTQQDWRSVVPRSGKLDYSKKCGAKGTRTSDGRPALCLPVAVIKKLERTPSGKKILKGQAMKKWKAKKGQRVPWHPKIKELHAELEASMPQDNPRQGKKQGSRSETDDFLGFLKARRDGKGQGSDLSSFSAYKASRSGSGRSEADDFLSFLKAKRAEKPSTPVRAMAGHRKRPGTDLHGRDLSGQDLSGQDLSGANLRDAILSGAKLLGSNLSGADLRGANLNHAHLNDAKLKGANLYAVRMIGADLRDANLEGANLMDAKLQRSTFLWANLSGANLTGTNLNNARLEGANLSGANLKDANLTGTKLEGANLTKVNLEGADLTVAHLTKVNLEGANLTKVNLEGADLRGADLSGAKLGGIRYDEGTEGTIWPRGFTPPPSRKT